MTQPISVQLDVLAELLLQLTTLGAELAEEEELAGSTGWAFPGALAGPVGEEAGLAGREWAGAVGALAARTLVVAATLDAALTGYRAAEHELALQIAGWAGGPPAGPLDQRAVLL